MVAGLAAKGARGLQIEITAAFGSRCGTALRDGVMFADQEGDHLVYPTGRHMVFRHIASNNANYVQESRRIEAVTACAMSVDRALLAVCERCSSEPFTQVSVYELQVEGTGPSQTLEEIGGAVGRLICAAFSGDADASLLCLASEAPELLLVVLDWRYNEVIGRATLSNAPSRVAFAPADSGLLSVSGSDFCQLWSVREGEFEVLHDFSSLVEETDASFTDHAWVEPGNNMFLVCTNDGRVHLIDSEEGAAVSTFTERFQLPAEEDEEPPEAESAPFTLRCFRSGFALGGPDGLVAIWQRVEDEEEDDQTESGTANVGTDFRHECTVRVRQTSAAVCCIDVAGEAEGRRLVFGFSDACIGHASLEQLQAPHNSAIDCDVLCGGCHSSSITSLCLAAHRPVIVSLSRQESCLRVWNCVTQRCEFVHEFKGEEPTGVAIHPLGFFLVVSFSEKLRFMQMMATELLPYRDLSLRNGRLMCFSNGGNFIAVAHAKLVSIFRLQTLQKVSTIRGLHQQVAAMSFDPTDSTLTTMSDDGSLAQWSTLTWQKNHDYSGRPVEALAVSAGNDGRCWVSVVEGRRVWLKSFRRCNPLEEEDVELPGNVRPCTLCQHKGPGGVAMLIGTAAGGLLTCNDLTGVPALEEFGLHAGACSAICFSGDGTTAITAGDDGMIFMLALSGATTADRGETKASIGDAAAEAIKVETAPVSNLVPPGGGVQGDVIMIKRGEIQASQDELQSLAVENANLQTRLVEEAAALQSECRDKVREATQKDQEEIQSLRLRYDSLQQAATAKERELLRGMKAKENVHVQAADALEQTYDAKICIEADRHAQLRGELEELETILETVEHESQRRLELQRQQQQVELSNRITEKDQELLKLKDLVDFAKHRFDTMLDQEGMEHDLEVAELKRKSQNDLEQKRLVEFTLKKEQDTHVRSLDIMEKERDGAVTEQAEAQAVKAGLEKNLQDLTQTVNSLKEERRGREMALRDKELEIGRFKVKVNTLNKFKRVLDFRLREVALSLKPKDQMIKELNAHLKDIDMEFERQLVMQRKMENVSKQKSEQIAKLSRESENLRGTIKQRDRIIAAFAKDLHELVDTQRDVRGWPDGIIQIYKDHVQMRKKEKSDDGRGTEELNRQIGVMQRKMGYLAIAGQQTEASCSKDIREKTDENSRLIQEVSDLRAEHKALEKHARELELKVRQMETKMAMESEVRDAARVAAKAIEAPSKQPQEDVNDPGPSLGGAAAALAALEDYFTSGPNDANVVARHTRAPTQKAPVERTAVVAPKALMRKKVSNKAKMEERKLQQRLLLEADQASQRIELQALENKLLKDQVHRLSLGEGLVGSAAPPAGGGVAAVKEARRQSSRGALGLHVSNAGSRGSA